MTYRGWRAQESRQVRITKGLHATEGWGVYIALDPRLAQTFSSGVRSSYLLKMEFVLDHPLVVREPCYILHESELLEDPIRPGDSVWLKASKHAFQQATSDSGSPWSQAQETIGFFLSDYLKKQGYDGVIVDQGGEDHWAVVFDPSRVRILPPAPEEVFPRTSSRRVRLAWRLVGGSG